MVMQSIKNILWAVDAFQTHPENLKNTAREVSAFADLCKAKVEIVYVYAVPKMLMAKSSFDAFQEPYLAQARANLESTAKFLKSKPSKITVLAEKFSGSAKNEIDVLMKYANRAKADVIAIASHGRNVLTKLFLGSFAESMIRDSDLPLLVIGPHQKRSSGKPLKSALYPADLSKGGEKFFSGFLPLAKKMGLDLHLIHGMINEYVPVVLSDAFLMGSFYSSHSSLFQESLEKRKVDLKKWLTLCKKHKISAKGEIYSSGGLVSDVIVSAAGKTRADFIIMTPDSKGPSPGSVSRKVIRGASVPVLLCKH